MPLNEHEPETPIWPAFGDLMACLFGLFVLFFVWMVSIQVTLTEDLEEAHRDKEAAASRVEALEKALALPLAAGLITLTDGNIGISGGVLFDSASARLSEDGERLLESIAKPLVEYLAARGESVMVSGFTDDMPLTGYGTFKDNWELSAQRALTVTRALIRAGLPAEWVFAAGFGPNHPVASNDTPESRAKNRRVEIRPVPRPTTVTPQEIGP
ncbi:MAG: OmpA family protein [Myxococcales bacterium]|nr:OmpA family protein [Myxococcales bacterium]